MRRRRKALAAGCCLGLCVWPTPTDAVGLGPEELNVIYNRAAMGAVMTGGTILANNVNHLPPGVIVAGELVLATVAAGIVLDDILKARARGTASSLAPDSTMGVAERVIDWEAWHPPMADPMAGRHYPIVNLTDSTALRTSLWVGQYEAGNQFGMFITGDGAHEGPNTYDCFVEADGRVGCYSAHTVVAADVTAHNKSMFRARSIDGSFASFTSAHGSYRVAEGAQLTCTSSRANASFCRVVTDSVECMVGSDGRVGCAAPAGGAGGWYGDVSGGCSAVNGIIHCTAAESTVTTMAAGAGNIRRALTMIDAPESPGEGRTTRPWARVGTPLLPLPLEFIILFVLAIRQIISEKLSRSRRSSAAAAAGTSMPPCDGKGERAAVGDGGDKDIAAGDRGASQDSTPALLEPKGSSQEVVAGVKAEQQQDTAPCLNNGDEVAGTEPKKVEGKDLEDEEEAYFKSILLPTDTATAPDNAGAQGQVAIDHRAGSAHGRGSGKAREEAPSAAGRPARASRHKGHRSAGTQVADPAAPDIPRVRDRSQGSKKDPRQHGLRPRKVPNSGQFQVFLDQASEDTEDEESGNNDRLVEDLLAKVESLQQLQDQAVDAHHFDLDLQKEEFDKQLQAETREKEELRSKTLAATKRADRVVGLLKKHGIEEFGQKLPTAAPVRPPVSPAPVPAMTTAEKRKLEALIATLRTEVAVKDARIAVLEEESANKDERMEAQAAENRGMTSVVSTVSEEFDKLLHKFNGDSPTDKAHGKGDSTIVVKVQILGDILCQKEGRISSLESLLADSIVARHVVVRRVTGETRKPWQDVVANQSDRICALEGIIAEQVVRSHIAVSKAAAETRAVWQRKMKSEVDSRDAKIQQLSRTVDNVRKSEKEKQRLKATADAEKQSLRSQVRDLRRELRTGQPHGPVQPAPPPYSVPAAATAPHQQQPQVGGLPTHSNPGAPLRPWALPFPPPLSFTTQPRGPGGRPTYTQQPYGRGFVGNVGGWGQGYRGGYQTGGTV